MLLSTDSVTNISEEIFIFSTTNANNEESSVISSDHSQDEEDEQSHMELSEILEKKKLRLLVVDDSRMSRKMLCRLLEAEGHKCDEAEDGLIALEIMKQSLNTTMDANTTTITNNNVDIEATVSGAHTYTNTNTYDAVLMDFVMPNMDGPTSTKHMRTLGYKNMIIGVTGNAMQKDIDHFTSCGASIVFTKPADISLILKSIQGNYYY